MMSTHQTMLRRLLGVETGRPPAAAGGVVLLVINFIEFPIYSVPP